MEEHGAQQVSTTPVSIRDGGAAKLESLPSASQSVSGVTEIPAVEEHPTPESHDTYNGGEGKAKAQRLRTMELTDQTNLLPARRVFPVFCGMVLCTLVSQLDTSVVATALPSIASHFNAGSVSSFIPTMYLLTSTVFQPLYGRFSDIFGRKSVLCTCLAVFMLGNLAAGFSTKVSEVIVFRGIAGVGGGGIICLVQIIVSDIVSLRDRGKYIGSVGIFLAFGQGVGPLLGGALAEKVSWRWCFWITPPVALVGILSAIFFLPLKKVEGDTKRKLKLIDYAGTILSLGGGTLLILPLVWGGVTYPWHSAIILGTLISSLAAFLLFCVWEWKGARLPIVPLYIFKHVTVCGVYITMFVSGFVYNSALYYLSEFFQAGLGYSPLYSGIFLLPVLAGSTFASFCSGMAVSYTGRYRAIVYSGYSTMALGCGLLSTVTSTTHKVPIVVYMILTGMGVGQTTQTTMVAAQASVPRKDMSVVTAVRNFMRSLGGTLALAVGSTIINNSLRERMVSLGLPNSLTDKIIDDLTLIPTLSGNTTVSLGVQISPAEASSILGALTSGFHSVFYLNAALSALCVVVSIAMIKHKELVRPDEKEMKRKAEEAYKRERQRKKETKDKDVEAEAGGPSPPGDLLELRSLGSRTDRPQDSTSTNSTAL